MPYSIHEVVNDVKRDYSVESVMEDGKVTIKVDGEFMHLMDSKVIEDNWDEIRKLELDQDCVILETIESKGVENFMEIDGCTGEPGMYVASMEIPLEKNYSPVSYLYFTEKELEDMLFPGKEK